MSVRPRPRRRRRTPVTASLAAALAVAGACGTPLRRPVDAVAPDGRPPQGHLFLVGGGPRPRALMEEFVRLAGGSGRARIAVLPIASADTSAGPALVAELRALGATAWTLAPTREGADSAHHVAAIDSATGVWFGGGDQNRITAALRDSRVGRAIQRRYQQGAVVGGTSAGAAALSATMITGEERRPGGVRPPRDSGDAWLTIERGDVVTAPGLGLFRIGIVDQHFARRKRHNRLLAVTMERAERLGIGVDESTALVVEPSGRWKVLGESVVVVYDARTAFISAEGPLGAVGILTSVLPPGSAYHPVTRQMTFP